jgi:hypothetical protein
MGFQPKLILERDGLSITHSVMDGCDNLVQSLGGEYEFTPAAMRAVRTVPGVDHAFTSRLDGQTRIFYGTKRAFSEETVAASVIVAIIGAQD